MFIMGLQNTPTVPSYAHWTRMAMPSAPNAMHNVRAIAPAGSNAPLSPPPMSDGASLSASIAGRRAFKTSECTTKRRPSKTKARVFSKDDMVNGNIVLVCYT